MLVSVSSEVPIFNSTWKEKGSCSFQPAAATTAFLCLKTVLREKVFVKQADFCLFEGFVRGVCSFTGIKKRGGKGTGVDSLYSLNFSAPAAIASERVQSDNPDALTWITKLCI